MKKLYLCDPDKNRQCKKTSCLYNKDSPYPTCLLTSDRRYAQLDDKGEPIEENDQGGETHVLQTSKPEKISGAGE
ncbi:MAG: hypothetical protein IJM87_08285 [Ruminococcus sp.]|nr:hypothetical protein [Ruminococcus sp.]